MDLFMTSSAILDTQRFATAHCKRHHSCDCCKGVDCTANPPHSPDLAPSDFHMFGPLKDYLRGQKFEDDDAVKSAVKAWIRQCIPELFENGFISWQNRWQKCVARNGDYV